MLRCLSLSLAIFCIASASAMIIPTNRVTTWQGNVGVQGGIPNRTTQHGPTLSSASTSAQINSAIASCPANGVVKLGAGTFNNLSTTINLKSNITLRGSGSDTTILRFTNGNTYIYGIGSGATFNPTLVTNWTAGYAQGTTQITVASTAGYAVGNLIGLDQLNDSAYIGGGSDGVSGQGQNAQRYQNHIAEITAIAGNLVTISPGLYMRNYNASFTPQMWKICTSPIVGAGIEDLKIDGINGSTDVSQFSVNLEYVKNCWLKNVESTKSNAAVVKVFRGKNFEIRDCWFHDGKGEGSGNYGVLYWAVTQGLIENNIINHITTATSVQGGSMGCVVGYNYYTDMTYPGSWLSEGISANHNAHPAFNLYEGNYGTSWYSDYIHGSGSDLTALRNFFEGWQTGKTQNTHPVVVEMYNRYVNVVGNILGKNGYHDNYEDLAPGAITEASIYKIGYRGTYDSTPDAVAISTLIRHGNFDYFTDTQIWETTNANVVDFTDHAIPNSHYLTASPSWFGNLTWPPFNPASPGSATATSIPAGYKFVNGVWPPPVGGGDPAPVLSSVSPNPLIGTNSNITFTASGSDFVTGAKIQVSNVGNGNVFTDTTTVFNGPTSLSVTLLVPDQTDTWLMRVKNPDNQTSQQVSVVIVTSVAPTITEVPGQRATSGNKSGASATHPFPLSVSSGDFLVVAGAVYASPAAPTSVVVTDSRSTTYTVILGPVVSTGDPTFRTFIAYGFAPTPGPCTVTVDPQGATGSYSWSQNAFLRVQSGAPVTNYAQGNTGSAGQALVMTTPLSNSVIIGVMTHGANTTELSAGPDFTTIGELNQNAAAQAHHMEFRVISASQPYPVIVGYESTNVANWGIQSASFPPAFITNPPDDNPGLIVGPINIGGTFNYAAKRVEVPILIPRPENVGQPPVAGIFTEGEEEEVTTVLTYASVGQDGNFLTLTFNKNITPGLDGASDGLAITTDGDATVATYLEGVGSSSLIYSLSETVLAVDTLTLDYVQPGDGLKSGTTVASFTEVEVYNGSFVDLTLPTITSATVSEDGTMVTLVFSYAVTATDNMTDGFTLTSDGDPQTMTFLFGDGNASITYTLSGTVLPEDVLTLDYDAGEGTVQDTRGNVLATFSDEPVTNNAVDSVAPELTSATVDTTGDVFTLVFDGAVTSGVDGLSSGFAIATDGDATVATYVSGTGTATLVYSLSATVLDADVLTLDYVQPGDGVQDAAANLLASFADQAIINDSTEI